jgi:acetoin utilization protein AcuC
MARQPAEGPLLVYGPLSLKYDFGPQHPLSPRRFRPGIELLKAVGARPGLVPEPATDRELGWLHARDYLAAVKRFSTDPAGEPAGFGIGPGDCPPFRGMHEASAAIAGGSIRAVEAILRGDVQHAYQPGGGLHHAARSRASGFCIYNDVALAIARARRRGKRVMYVDLDVHHGDGVQALHYDDPGVLTVSFHETGDSLFPGTGFVKELGEGSAAATSVNVPFEPLSGPGPWLAAVRSLVPALAASFGPDLIVSQHGADGHVWDPLAHLSLTTTAMGEAARLVDRVAHRYAGGRWLATGGGGYAIYRVVPRVWALTWLAGAHREVPRRLPAKWLERWAWDASRWADDLLPETFEDAPDIPSERSLSEGAAERSERTVELVRSLVVPELLRLAEERGWWRADEEQATGRGRGRARPAAPDGSPTPVVVTPITPGMLERLRLAPRVVAPTDPETGMRILRAALAERALIAGAVSGEWLLGVALAAPVPDLALDRMVALGVAPEARRRGVATALLRALLAEQDRRGRALAVVHTAAERDPFEPLPRDERRRIADRLLRTGFETRPAPARLTAADPQATVAVHLPPGAAPGLRAAALQVADPR